MSKIIIFGGAGLYIENMKVKKIYCLLATISLLPTLAACSGEIDYFDYVSEYRSGVYIFSEDGRELKIYCSRREVPYSLDGMKGELNDTVEVFYTCPSTPGSVKIEIGGLEGEMNYRSVTRDFYLCFTAPDFAADAVDVLLTTDGESSSVKALNVKDEGVIDGRQALEYVLQYDGDRFAALTEGRRFAGEINVRLLYDDDCYYYVGVTDRDKNTYAYLLNGTDGRVIAEKS